MPRARRLLASFAKTSHGPIERFPVLARRAYWTEYFTLRRVTRCTPSWDGFGPPNRRLPLSARAQSFNPLGYLTRWTLRVTLPYVQATVDLRNVKESSSTTLHTT